ALAMQGAELIGEETLVIHPPPSPPRRRAAADHPPRLRLHLRRTCPHEHTGTAKISRRLGVAVLLHPIQRVVQRLAKTLDDHVDLTLVDDQGRAETDMVPGHGAQDQAMRLRPL